MKLVKRKDGEEYEVPDHTRCYCEHKLNGKRFAVSLSHFLPGGGAGMSSIPKERVYYVMSGAIAVSGKSGEYLVESGDMIYIEPGEEREFQAVGNEVATILVIGVDA